MLGQTQIQRARTRTETLVSHQANDCHLFIRCARMASLQSRSYRPTFRQRCMDDVEGEGIGMSSRGAHCYGVDGVGVF